MKMCNLIDNPNFSNKKVGFFDHFFYNEHIQLQTNEKTSTKCICPFSSNKPEAQKKKTSNIMRSTPQLILPNLLLLNNNSKISFNFLLKGSSKVLFNSFSLGNNKIFF